MYNREDVDAMVVATVMEEERKTKERDELFDDFQPGENKIKKKVLMA